MNADELACWEELTVLRNRHKVASDIITEYLRTIPENTDIHSDSARSILKEIYEILNGRSDNSEDD